MKKLKNNKMEPLYQYNRSISFCADLTEHKTQDFLKRLKLSEEVSDFSDLSKLLLTFHDSLKKIICSEFNKKQICKNLSINKTWLKVWHKDIFHLYIKKNQKNKYPLKDIIQINSSDSKKTVSSSSNYKRRNPQQDQNFNQNINFEDKLNRWKSLSQTLKEMFDAKAESQFRKSDISENLKALLSNQGVFYFESFLKELHSSDSTLDDQIIKLKRDLKKIRETLEALRKKYQPSQAEGLEIAKASLNYYTVDKKPKEYDEEFSEAKIKLGEDYFLSQENSSKVEFFSKIIQSEKLSYLWRTKTKEIFTFDDSNIYDLKKKCKEMNIELSNIQKLNLEQTSQLMDFCRSKNFITQKWNLLDSEIIAVNRYELKSINDDKKNFQFKSEQEKEWIERYCKKKLEANLKENDIGLSLNQTYFLMKAFKAEQRQIFDEVLKHVIKYKISLDNNSLGNSQNETRNLFSGFTIDKSYKKGEIEEQDNKLGYQINNEKHFLNGYKIDSKYLQSFDNFNKLFSIFGFKKLKKENTKKLKSYPKKRYEMLYEKDVKEHYSFFIQLTKKLNTKTQQNSKQIAKERGDWLFGKHCYFQNYKIFCNEYKKIAQQRGKLIAQIKGIEKEKRESSQTDYWALIYTVSDNKKQLWLVPKKASQDINTDSENTNLQSAKQYIDQNDSIKIKTDSYLSCFVSLTMRALHKLCFAEESSFVKAMPDYLKKQQKKVKEFKTNKGEKEKLKEKEQKEIQFLKELLKSPYAHKKLQLDNFDLNEIYEAKDKKEFELALEKACYYEKKIALSDKEKQYFLKQFNVSVLNISSYDLEGRNKNTYQSPASENRIHTDWWNKFWKQSKSNQDNSIGAIRLNPEVKIRYREEDKNLKKYLKNRGFSIEDNNFKHRKIQDQITIHFTLSLNAGKKYEDLAFSKPEEILQKIEDFNKKLNKDRNFDTAWKYGIDRGNIELATLCLAKFKPEETYKVNEKIILKPTFPKPEKDIPCYSLEDYNLTENYQTKTEGKKTRFAVKNISYFLKEKYLNNTKFFKKENLTCLDLTTAKVIKGKIITNGDIMTYLKLKKAVAKRRLFELYTKKEIYSSSKLEWCYYENGKENSKRSAGVLNIKTNEGEKTIYWYCEKYEDILIDSKNNIKYNQESIKNSLRFYLDSLKKSNNSEHTPSILKINHLRDSITANMVGVICFLQKEYPGFIILEDLYKKIIDKHFFQHEENISRRLENALYNKFQSLGLVPPHVKDIIQLRESYRENRDKNKSGLEDKKLSQIGAICFVPEENTSKNCPYCEKPANKNDDLKFRQRRFLCDENSCGFDTYYFKNYKEDPKPEVDESKKKIEFEIIKDIDDPDKVASFNIAKKKPL